MRLRFLVISDTHLGEDTSVLGFPSGRRRLWEAVRDLFGAGKDGTPVDELILLGDIPDRTLSSTRQILSDTNALMQTLGSALDVRRMVYVPGNHDHTLWTDYDEARHPTPIGSTPLDGELIVKQGAVVEGALEASKTLLSLFFGWPNGSQWHAIEKAPLERRPDFAIANPLYAAAHAGRTYLFAHGTHFRPDVTMPKWLQMLADYAELDKLLGGIEIQSTGDLSTAASLADLERLVAPFVDTLWPSSGNKAITRSDRLWYVLTFLSGKFDQRRAPPENSQLFTTEMLAALDDDARIRRLTREHDFTAKTVKPVERYADGSIDRCQRLFLPLALQQARAAGLGVDKVSFVYGDTHDGGFGRLPGLAPDDEVRVYNTGGWVVHDPAHHPACHLFAVDEEGNEYLADLTFKGVQALHRPLLQTAAADLEHRKEATSKVLRALFALLSARR